MNKKFCNKCNGATFYEDEIPNACSKCGSLFAGAVLASIQLTPVTRPPKKIVARQIEEYEEQEEADEDEAQARPLQKMEVQVNVPKREKGGTLGDLLLDKGSKNNVPKRKNKKVNLKGFDKEWNEDLSKGGRSSSAEIGGQS